MVNHFDALRRRELNARLAAELEQAGGADPETLGVHLEGAGELKKAGYYYALAADEASGRLAFDRAVKLYRRALELGQDDASAACGGYAAAGRCTGQRRSQRRGRASLSGCGLGRRSTRADRASAPARLTSSW